jgi:hypothetical protein
MGMKPKISMRSRVSRFLSERYAQRERPSCFADFFVWGLIVVLAAWPILLLAHAVANGNWIETLARIWF